VTDEPKSAEVGSADPNLDLWRPILERVKSMVNPQSYSTWFEPTRLVRIDEGELVVEGPNQFFVDWLAEHHLDKLEDAAAQVLGARPRIQFTAQVHGQAVQRIVRTPERPLRLGRQSSAPSIADGLDPRYTFQEFVVGPNSRLTYAACLAVAEKPGHVYNPLFIYGGVGLGKTHIMHAIGRFVRDEQGLRVHYTSSESFMNELILAIRQGKTFEFRNRYRTVDVLLIDDIQFLSGRVGLKRSSSTHSTISTRRRSRSSSPATGRPRRSIRWKSGSCRASSPG